MSHSWVSNNKKGADKKSLKTSFMKKIVKKDRIVVESIKSSKILEERCMVRKVFVS